MADLRTMVRLRDETIAHQATAIRTLREDLAASRARVRELESRPCPFVVQADEGTAYCRLAESTPSEGE